MYLHNIMYGAEIDDHEDATRRPLDYVQKCQSSDLN